MKGPVAETITLEQTLISTTPPVHALLSLANTSSTIGLKHSCIVASVKHSRQQQFHREMLDTIDFVEQQTIVSDALLFSDVCLTEFLFLLLNLLL